MVEALGDQLLAGAALADHQHRPVERRGAFAFGARSGWADPEVGHELGRAPRQRANSSVARRPKRLMKNSSRFRSGLIGKSMLRMNEKPIFTERFGWGTR